MVDYRNYSTGPDPTRSGGPFGSVLGVTPLGDVSVFGTAVENGRPVRKEGGGRLPAEVGLGVEFVVVLESERRTGVRRR